MGTPSAINLTFFGNQDFVWGVALMISGAFIAFSINKYGVSAFRKDAVDVVESDWKAGRGWELLMKFVIPAQAIVLLGWWIWLSVTEYAPDTWFNPLDPYSVMTMLAQWGIVITVFVLSNNWMVRRTLGSSK